MPTYSYRCANCDHAFDQYQAFTDDTLIICPNCGEPQLRKVFNSIAVSFTGSGFYRNDSRADNGKKADSASSSGDSSAPKETSSSGDSSSGKVENKPKAEKSESKPSTPASKPAASSTGSTSS